MYGRKCMKKYNAEDDPIAHESLPKELMSTTCSILSSDEKLVLARAWTLSKQGSNEILFTNGMLAKRYGFSLQKAGRIVRKLAEKGYVKLKNKRNQKKGSVERHLVWLQSTEHLASESLYTEQSDSSHNKQSENSYTEQSDCLSTAVPKFTASEQSESSQLMNIPLYKNEINKNEEKKEAFSSSTLTFDSVFSQMVKINEEEFTPKGTGFAEEDIRSDARTYTMKFKGKPTRDSMYKWMISGDERRREQRKTQLESNQNSSVPLPKKMTAAQIRAGLLAHQKKYGQASPFYVGGDYEY